MNSGLRPLPRTMPFLERCRIMVARGEAKTFDEARRMIGRKPKRKPAPSTPSNYRPLYFD